MTEYLVKIGFWLHAYDSITIEAGSDAEAVVMARSAAKAALEGGFHPPEHVDFDQPREGVIAYIDRLDCGDRECIGESIEFDEDRIHPVHDDASPTGGTVRSKGDE